MFRVLPSAACLFFLQPLQAGAVRVPSGTASRRSPPDLRESSGPGLPPGTIRPPTPPHEPPAGPKGPKDVKPPDGNIFSPERDPEEHKDISPIVFEQENDGRTGTPDGGAGQGTVPEGHLDDSPVGRNANNDTSLGGGGPELETADGRLIGRLTPGAEQRYNGRLGWLEGPLNCVPLSARGRLKKATPS